MNKQLLMVGTVIMAVMFIGVLAYFVTGLNAKSLSVKDNTTKIFDNSNAYDLSKYVDKTISGQEVINIVEYYANYAPEITQSTMMSILLNDDASIIEINSNGKVDYYSDELDNISIRDTYKVVRKSPGEDTITYSFNKQ
jgi:hypothetical protein